MTGTFDAGTSTESTLGTWPESGDDQTPTVKLDNVIKSYGEFRAVDGVTLDFFEGETIGVVGPNGAGKTTLFGLISGSGRVSAGHVWLKGSDVTKLSALRRARRGVSRTFQTARVFQGLTVQEHLLLARREDDGRRMGWAKSRRALSDVVQQYVLAAAEDYGLLDVLNEEVANLTQAHHKILDLAMALLSNPDILLLDEPTAGVALEDLSVIMKLLDELRSRSPNLTIILSSHDVDLVARLCTRIVVLVRGQVLADGPIAEVVNDPKVREAYFGTSLDD